MITELINKITKRSSNEIVKWLPIKQSFINEEEYTNVIHDKGYVIAGKLTEDQLSQLRKLYSELHNFQQQEGGMFYSVYSRDVAYRKKVNDDIRAILKPTYDTLFHDYKTVINSYIVKVSGPESEFSLHQDSTGLDEMKYSCVSVWIPLQDTNNTNGCLSVVPHSHKMFSPYRGISFPQQFENISNTVRKYLQPIEMKAGEILLFDNRLVHTSGVNSLGEDRVVVMSGIFPSDAKIVSCFKDTTVENSPIEIIEQADDYLITFENFFHDCTCRPETGTLIGTSNWDTSQMSEKQFLVLCKEYGLKENSNCDYWKASERQSIIGEPVTKQ
jgi:hypothetical protein